MPIRGNEPNMEWVDGVPVAATHYVFTKTPPRGMETSDTPCGYHLEPYEVAQQDFSSDPKDVTCKACVAFLARQTERVLAARAKRGL